MRWKVVIAIVVGAALGLAFQQIVGCRTGTCAITSNPWISTLYGGLMGWLWSGDRRRAKAPPRPDEPPSPADSQG